MANILKVAVLLLAASFIPGLSFGQEAKEPLRWTVEAKKKNDTQYELIIHCLVAKGWHIFGAHPGGDGTITPTSITFTKNINANYTGPLKENGKTVAKAVEGVKGNINVYEGRVDFVQQATITGKGKIFATLTYQAGNEKLSLPKKARDFVFEIQ